MQRHFWPVHPSVIRFLSFNGFGQRCRIEEWDTFTKLWTIRDISIVVNCKKKCLAILGIFPWFIYRVLHDVFINEGNSQYAHVKTWFPNQISNNIFIRKSQWWCASLRVKASCAHYVYWATVHTMNQITCLYSINGRYAFDMLIVEIEC